MYNTEEYIVRCLTSIKEQTLEEYEVLVVNDGSTDNSENECCSFIFDKPKFRLINQQHRGVTNARFCGWKEAIGKYIVFIDSDDIIEPDYCKALYEACETTNSPLAICAYQMVTDNGIFSIVHLPFKSPAIYDIQDDYIKPLIAGVSKTGEMFPVSLCIRMMLRERITEDCFIDRNKVFSEDRCFNLFFAQYVEKIAVIQQPLYNYYHHLGSFVHSYRSNVLEMCNNLYEVCLQYCKKNRIYNTSFCLSSLLVSGAWSATRNAAAYLSYSDFKKEYRFIRHNNKIDDAMRSIRLFSDEFRLLLSNQKIVYIMFRFVHPRIVYHFYKWRVLRRLR